MMLSNVQITHSVEICTLEIMRKIQYPLCQVKLY